MESLWGKLIWPCINGLHRMRQLFFKKELILIYSRPISIFHGCQVNVDIRHTSRMARSMLVVTPSPSLLTRQLLIGWRAPLRRLIPFWRSASLHTSTLSPERGLERRYWNYSEQATIQPFLSFFVPLIPVVSTPFLPARPAICLYVSGSNKRPLKVGVRMMTLRAGRLTPEERVEVAARTLTIPWRKAPSNTSRSSNVKPTEEFKLCLI